MATAAVGRCRLNLASSRRISVPLHGRQLVTASWGGGGLDVGGRGGRSSPLRPPRGWATGAAAAEEESGWGEAAGTSGKRRAGARGGDGHRRPEGGNSWGQGGGRGFSQNRQTCACTTRRPWNAESARIRRSFSFLRCHLYKV
jgi:hypothetical protein